MYLTQGLDIQEYQQCLLLYQEFQYPIHDYHDPPMGKSLRGQNHLVLLGISHSTRCLWTSHLGELLVAYTHCAGTPILHFKSYKRKREDFERYYLYKEIDIIKLTLRRVYCYSKSVFPTQDGFLATCKSDQHD